MARCPFHDDPDPSCTLYEDTNSFHCFGCEASGTGIDYVMRSGLANTPQDAADYIVQRWGLGLSVDPPPENKDKKTAASNRPYTLADYSQGKGLPADFLAGLGLSSEKGWVHIPYHLEDGSPGPVRYRQWQEFRWRRNSKLCLYGLDRLNRPGLPEDNNEYVILVEGESDSQTLWLHGYPALGVPGAKNFKTEWAGPLLRYKRIYVHQEPDEAGVAFVRIVAGALKAAGYEGQVLVISTPGYKDPNELHQHTGDAYLCKKALDAALEAAREPTGEEAAGKTFAAGPESGPGSVDEIILRCREDPQRVFDEQTIGALALMPVSDQAKVKTALKGKVNGRDFDQAIRDIRRRMKSQLRLAGQEGAGPRLPDALPGCPLDAPLPAAWQISQGGVFEVVTKQGEYGPNTSIERRFPVPVVLSAALTPLDSQDETCSYEVAWQNGAPGSWRRVAMDAAAVFDRHRLTGAANFGLPVDSENSKGLLRWLAALRDTREVPARKVVSRNGWHGAAEKLYIWGEQVLAQNQANDVSWTPNIRGTEREMVAALGTRGDADAQKDFLLQTCRRWPLAAFLVGASAAAPLLRLLREHSRLDVDGWTVEVVSDQAGVGKSTGIEVAASIWGQPSRLVRTCDRTSVAWEVLRHVFSDMPIFLEEVQLAKPEDREKIVYSQAQGMGRERGSRSGGLRATRRFYNVQILASEQSLKDSGSREGVEARVVSLPPVFGRRTPEHAVEVQGIRKQCGANYGHAGQAYVRYLVEEINGGRWEGILERFDQYEATLQRKISTEASDELRSMAMRMASRVAACGLGLQLLLIALDVDAAEVPSRAMMAAWNEVLQEIDAMPVWKKALSVIRSWAAENKNRIEGMEAVGYYGPKTPGASYIGKQVQLREGGRCICFYQNPFNDLIGKYFNQDGRGVLKAFKREGIVVLGDRDKPTRNIGGGVRAFCFDYETIFPSDDDG